MLPLAKGLLAGKRCASPSVRITRVHVLRPRKSNSRSTNGACGRVCCAHPPTAYCARSAPASAGPRVARGHRPRLRPGAGHALVSRGEGSSLPRDRRPGTRTGGVAIRSVTGGALPRHPGTVDAWPIPLPADHRSGRRRPGRPAEAERGNRDAADRSPIRSPGRLTCPRCRPKVASRASADRGEVHQGELATTGRTASRVDRSKRRNPRRVRVFSATTMQGLDGSLASIR